VKKNRHYYMLLVTAISMILLLTCAPFFHEPLVKLLSVVSYITWHSIFEFSSIIISICIFCVAYYSFEQNRNFRNLFLGSMLLLMAFIDFFHTMTYKGMPVFLVPITTSNTATTFWIIARLIGGFGLLAASIIPTGLKFRLNKVFFFILPVVISLLILNLVIYHPGVLPLMYIEKEGLTDTKILLEAVVILSYLFAVLFLIREYRESRDRTLMLLSAALIIGIFSELSFTLYVDVYGVYNFLGHLLKFTLYFIIFRVTFIQNIKRPYLDLSIAKDEIKNYADNLDRIVEQRTEQIKQINQKLLDDLEYARDIQLSMLPKKLPNSQNAVFEACYFPADRVGGDFYNIFKINETKIGMYIGDVSGHGVSAAMLTVFLNQSVKAKKDNAHGGAKEVLLPSEVLKNLFLDFNETEFKSEVYIVMLYGIYDLETRDFTFSSAGLNVPPLILNASGEVSELSIKGFPICKFPNIQNVEYHDSAVKLKNGDKILFYTDGLTDAENTQKNQYSDSRLKGQLQKNKSLSTSQLTKLISDDVFRFIGCGKPQDDITFFVMEVKR
jgi:sigma-B regulation protein RsbU (phosphoserine phosphatase)